MELRLTCLLLNLAALLATGVTYAEVDRRLTLDEKVAAADTIVHARCLGVQSEWRNGLVFTTAEYTVVEDLRGGAKTGLRLTVPGGTAMHPTLGIPVSTRLSNGVEVRVDDEVILFAKRDGAGEMRLISGEQSYVRIGTDERGIARIKSDERRVVAKPSAEATTPSSTVAATEISSETYSVTSFKQNIRAAVARQPETREKP